MTPKVNSSCEKIASEMVANKRMAALQDLDLEGDWDPDSHDQQMSNLYGDDEDPTDEKPRWDVDIDMGDILVEHGAQETSKKQTMKKKQKEKKKKDAIDEGVDVDAMDADIVLPGNDDEEWDGTEEMRKRKLDEYLDEIYGLDFNDMASFLNFCPVQF